MEGFYVDLMSGTESYQSRMETVLGLLITLNLLAPRDGREQRFPFRFNRPDLPSRIRLKQEARCQHIVQSHDRVLFCSAIAQTTVVEDRNHGRTARPPKHLERLLLPKQRAHNFHTTSIDNTEASNLDTFSTI
jgi:hypothetical protein